MCHHHHHHHHQVTLVVLSSLIGLLGCILYLHRADVKSLLVDQHLNVNELESITERRLWIRPCFSSSAPQILFVLLEWFMRWEASGTYWDRHQHATSKGRDSYRWAIGQTWLIKWNVISSKQRSCRYCCMDALYGR